MRFSEPPCAEAPCCVLRIPLHCAQYTTDQIPTFVASFVDFQANEPTKDSKKVPDSTHHAPRTTHHGQRTTRPLLSAIPFLLLTLVFLSVPACKPKSSDEFIRLTNTGKNYYDRGEAAKAVAALEAALALNPAHPDAHLNWPAPICSPTSLTKRSPTRTRH